MKTLNKQKMKLSAVEFIPENLEPGILYYSEIYKTAAHICPCGCGKEYSVPISEDGWNISNIDLLTIQPSFHHRINCMAHYIISDGYANIVNIPKHKDRWNERYGFQSAQPGE